jgi:hypothetical protein
MTRRVRSKEGRPFYRFPWSKKAIEEAVAMATIHEREPSLPRIPLRTIAQELFDRGFVVYKPDPATLSRMLAPELARRQALAELEQKAMAS